MVDLKEKMHKGSPMKESLAIAYNIAKRKKKMAKGGEVKPPEGEVKMASMDPEKAKNFQEGFKKALGFAKGGMVENEDEHPMHEPAEAMEMEHEMPELEEDMPGHLFGSSAIVKAIAKKRMMAHGGMCYAKGGMVDEDGMLNDDRAESLMQAPEYNTDTYPDPDNVEHTEGMEEAPHMKKKRILEGIMRGIRSAHMGK